MSFCVKQVSDWTPSLLSCRTTDYEYRTMMPLVEKLRKRKELLILMFCALENRSIDQVHSSVLFATLTMSVLYTFLTPHQSLYEMPLVLDQPDTIVNMVGRKNPV